MTTQRMTQRDKQKRGESGEADISSALRVLKLWNHKLINYGFGTVFDKIIIPPRGGYAIEVKVRKMPRIAYNLKSITQNERKGLDRFVELVGRRHAFIIGIWKATAVERAFLIPWVDVRDDVCSGRPGSINMLVFREIEKSKGEWDLSCFGR